MIKKIFNILAISTLVVVGMVATASAQEPTRTKDVKIDFDFYAGKKLMPAGEYIVKLLPNTTTHKLILVQQVDGKKQSIVTSVPNQNKANFKPGVLVFNKYGSKYFLSGVQLGSESVLHTTVKTRTEREVAKGIAKNEAARKLEEVVIAGSLQ
ncbi:MAG: hypothetical protein L0226_16420 [Acidobacteria bacterium]|nr:hypothetical protein [Acidobacteriota bacterium]